MFYLVKWTGYELDVDGGWEEAGNLQDNYQLLQWKKNPKPEYYLENLKLSKGAGAGGKAKKK